MKKWKIGALCAIVCVLVILLGSVVAFLAVDRGYGMEFTVSAPQDRPHTLEVSLKLRSSLLSRDRQVVLYTGGKEITLRTVGGGEIREAEDTLECVLGRGKEIQLVYDVTVGAEGKHGRRGAVTEDYCVFDGGQALLLPMEFYADGFPEQEAVVSRLRVQMDPREGWTAVLPFEELTDLTWMDAYNINNNCFAMGRFVSCALPGQDTGVRVYRVSGEENELSGQTLEGIAALDGYYQGKFSKQDRPYQAILLPAGEGAVIGGAGAGSVCATFDETSKRDWELLSHRMFHAYFDTAFPTQRFHAAPQLWFYEGLATYYENQSVAALPESVRTVAGIQPETQFAPLFNQYLYIKVKDPALFSFAPMDEARISESEGRKEFLHYIQAPLVVWLVESLAGQEDAILRELTAQRDRGEVFEMEPFLVRVLGNQAGGVYNNYFQSDALLPLWKLKAPDRTEEQVLQDLNTVEQMLASWMTQQLGQYPCDVLDLETVRRIQNRPEFQDAVFADAETETQIKAYSPAIWSLLKEYALWAQVCGVEFDEPMLRYHLLSDKENLKKWKNWLEG
ncbi:hypothetical protein [Anaeromassilibacillus senegalensis]|uniref:hypothetical protein n=1 Tax=Anaeromassilibacillus senegalensis TaxID=1673717 RepID=UPI0006811F0F|nr:hypothetical protein [Anaeromassilibacillus senegalensis]